MRRVVEGLREIDRNSRTVKRDRFDRVTGAGFVLGVVLAPLLAWQAQRSIQSTEPETVLEMRAYFSRDDDVVRIQAIDPTQGSEAWRTVVTLADIAVVRDRTRAGWPFTTLETLSPTRIEATLTPSCRESRRSELVALAETVAVRERAFAGEEVRTHLASWVFSSVVWWVIVSIAVSATMSIARLGWYLARRGRTVVRQRRIDRCLCPSCGYDTKQSVLIGRCPECGSEIYERPEVY